MVSYIKIYSGLNGTSIERVKGEIKGDLNEEIPTDRNESDYTKPDRNYLLSNGEDTFKYELDYYGLDMKKPYDLKYALIPLMSVTIVTVLGISSYILIDSLEGGLRYGLLMSFVMLIMATILVILELKKGKKNNAKIGRVNNLKDMYELNKDFYLAKNFDKEFRGVRSFITEVKDNGLSKLLTVLNKPYVLEDGIPIRLHETIKLVKGKLVISEDLYTLTKEEDFKELLLTPELTETELIKKYNILKENNENEKHYESLTQSFRQLEGSEEKYLKALEYSKEYRRKINIKKEKGIESLVGTEWEDRLIETLEDKKRNLSESQELVED